MSNESNLDIAHTWDVVSLDDMLNLPAELFESALTQLQAALMYARCLNEMAVAVAKKDGIDIARANFKKLVIKGNGDNSAVYVIGKKVVTVPIIKIIENFEKCEAPAEKSRIILPQ